MRFDQQSRITPRVNPRPPCHYVVLEVVFPGLFLYTAITFIALRTKLPWKRVVMGTW